MSVFPRSEAQSSVIRTAACQAAQIHGSDISPVAVRATLANLDRAGLLPAVSLRSGDILEIDAPALAAS